MKMKKIKIKDLTEEQIKEYCKSKKNCYRCRFLHVECRPGFKGFWGYNKEIYKDEFLEEELEFPADPKKDDWLKNESNLKKEDEEYEKDSN